MPGHQRKNRRARFGGFAKARLDRKSRRKFRNKLRLDSKVGACVCSTATSKQSESTCRTRLRKSSQIFQLSQILRQLPLGRVAPNFANHAPRGKPAGFKPNPFRDRATPSAIHSSRSRTIPQLLSQFLRRLAKSIARQGQRRQRPRLRLESNTGRRLLLQFPKSGKTRSKW